MKALVLLVASCLVCVTPAYAQYATGESPYENFNHVSPERQAAAEAEQTKLREQARDRARRQVEPKR